MKKVQMQLETVMGMNRKVKGSNLDKLEYLDMVIKERMRIHQVQLLIIPIAIEGRLHDPNAWDEAEKFWLKRLEGT
ncbi:hypothetical protein CR513_61751, partial [Mucuna pruriens]